tara:strand:+ start:20682 stop:21275 length:594 start_codon:yes stop_codon:yes gene_type:complete
MELILFYGFAFLQLASAALVVFSDRPIKSALFLVMTFIASSAMWLLQYAEFLALALIFVYVGAVMTLFLFVVMMLNVDSLPSGLSLKARVGLGLLVALLAFGVGFTYWVTHPASQLIVYAQKVGPIDSNTVALGKLIYTDYIIAFEMVALVLLVAMISAIVLVFRGPNPGNKTQKVKTQVAANRANRLKIVKFGDQT